MDNIIYVLVTHNKEVLPPNVPSYPSVLVFDIFLYLISLYIPLNLFIPTTNLF